MTVLVMAAKTNLINDYDSWWYGLRSNYVFEQGGSIFADLGLSHFVFYYPKLYEALILPLCAFPDSKLSGIAEHTFLCIHPVYRARHASRYDRGQINGIDH